MDVTDVSAINRPKLWWRKTAALVMEQLRRGVSPGRLALACSLALWIGLIPTLGVSTALCAALALALGLNQAAMQAVNFMAYPLQLICLFPFLGLGARVFHGPWLTLSPADFLKQTAQHPWPVIKEFWKLGLHALAVWAVLGLCVVPLVWLLLRWVLGRLPLPKESV